MRLNRAVRASEWWEYKIAPVLAAFYGTLLIAGLPVSASWRAALMLVVAIAAEAAFVSVLNDVTDREVDRAAGKTLRHPSPLMLVLSVAIGAGVGWLWRHDARLVMAYAAGWLAFALYSLPPFRLKTRGIAGVICDAAGAHLFPALTAVLLASHAVNRAWLAAVAVWAFSSGVRGILWHQLRDAEADRRAGVRTFVMRHGVAFAERAGSFVVFPLQLVALAAMLWQLHSVWPLVALALYAVLMLLRPFRWDMHAAIVRPSSRSFQLLNEFDEGYLPVAILAASGELHRADWIVLAVHLALFPRHTWQNAREVAGLVRLRRHARKPA